MIADRRLHHAAPPHAAGAPLVCGVEPGAILALGAGLGHNVEAVVGDRAGAAGRIEQMVDALGARLEERRQEVAAQFEHGEETVLADEITDTMVVCIDAGKAPTKGNERIDDDKRKRYDREFRDVKVASV